MAARDSGTTRRDSGTTRRDSGTTERVGALLATRRAVGRRFGVVLGILALAAVVAGCGVPVDNGPTALARAGVPFDLLTPSSPSTSTTTVSPSPSQTLLQVFLLGPSGRLVPVTRSMPGVNQGTQATLTAALEALVAGPTVAETVQQGLQSAIPPQTTLVGVTIGPQGLVTVDLGGTFAQLVGIAQIEAVAQVVFTSMEFSGVNAVTFQLSGEPVAVPTETGEQARVVNESQYGSLAPAPVVPHNVIP